MLVQNKLFLPPPRVPQENSSQLQFFSSYVFLHGYPSTLHSNKIRKMETGVIRKIIGRDSPVNPEILPIEISLGPVPRLANEMLHY